jgi:hypothetical protein
MPKLNPNITRFPNGLTNSSDSDPLANLSFPSPLKNIVFFDDFVNNITFPIATTGLQAASTSTWAVTVTEGGAGNAASALTDEHGGVLSLTTDAADNDLIFAQHNNESFLPASGKRLFFKTRFSITDATANSDSILNTEWYIGLMVTDTDPLSSAAGDGVTDGLFFMSEDGSQTINFMAQKDATTGQLTTDTTATLTVATYTTLAFEFDGSRYIHLYKDDALVKTVDLTATLATYLPDTELTVSFGVKNGEAVAKIFKLDYIFVAQER